MLHGFQKLTSFQREILFRQTNRAFLKLGTARFFFDGWYFMVRMKQGVEEGMEIRFVSENIRCFEAGKESGDFLAG